jgi:hypothetical protein
MMNNDRPPVKTDSLQPTLTWKSLGMTESKYDLVIYTGIARGQNALMGQRGYYIPGIEAYYKEGIDGCSHHVEKPLEPKTVYVWSVRTRNGSSIGQWAKYEVQAIGESWNNLWWDFRTPN